MYVCVCNAVTERDIALAAQQGIRRLRELRHILGVTSECGRCARCALDCLRACHGEDTEPNPSIRRNDNERRQTSPTAAQQAARA
ncbi:MAG: (2Fe-2S)-binding protein [Betaproteobacteria bacterium]|nr:(2Fe-2S)-binding protein [Betaproteobacteria bacterium]